MVSEEEINCSRFQSFWQSLCKPWRAGSVEEWSLKLNHHIMGRVADILSCGPPR